MPLLSNNLNIILSLLSKLFEVKFIFSNVLVILFILTESYCIEDDNPILAILTSLLTDVYAVTFKGVTI